MLKLLFILSVIPLIAQAQPVGPDEICLETNSYCYNTIPDWPGWTADEIQVGPQEVHYNVEDGVLVQYQTSKIIAYITNPYKLSSIGIPEDITEAYQYESNDGETTYVLYEKDNQWIRLSGELDDNGNIIQKTIATFTEEHDIPGITVETRTEGKNKKTTSYIADGWVDSPLSTTTETYDAQGKLLSSTQRTYENGVLISENTTTYETNSQNKNKSKKRIYTTEEAEKVSKPSGNRFRIRYK